MTAGRPPGIPKSPNSGKQANHGPNKKKMSTAEMRSQIHDDLVAVYQKLGGVEWLLKIAQEFPLEFLRQRWARLAPPFLKDNPETLNQLNLTINTMSDIEKARRVSFLLSKAAAELEDQRVIEHQPSIFDEIEVFNQTPAPTNWRLPDPVPSEPVDIEQYKADALVADTKECSIESYPGSSSEQGFKRRNLI